MSPLTDDSSCISSRSRHSAPAASLFRKVKQHAESITVAAAKAKTGTSWVSLDSLGIIASVICVIHCLTLPLLVSVMPLVGAQFLESDFTHELLAGFVVIFAVASLLPGYMKSFDSTILFGLCSGLGLVLFATFLSEPMLGPSWELPLISIGNLIVVFTHLRNRKQSHVNCNH